MYTPAKTIDEFENNVPDGKLLINVTKLVEKTIKVKGRLFDNGRTFSSIAFGKLGNPEKFKDYADAGIINITGQKNYVGLYIWTGGDGSGIVERLGGTLPKSSIGKGCVFIKNQEFLDKNKTIIEEIVKEAFKEEK